VHEFEENIVGAGRAKTVDVYTAVHKSAYASQTEYRKRVGTSQKGELVVKGPTGRVPGDQFKIEDRTYAPDVYEVVSIGPKEANYQVLFFQGGRIKAIQYWQERIGERIKDFKEDFSLVRQTVR
jgi:hypothetical protein